jgi:hypothetical protein
MPADAAREGAYAGDRLRGEGGTESVHALILEGVSNDLIEIASLGVGTHEAIEHVTWDLEVKVDAA